MVYSPPGNRHFLDKAAASRGVKAAPGVRPTDQAAAVGPLVRIFRHITNASRQTDPALATAQLELCHEEFHTLGLALEAATTGLHHAYEGMGIPIPDWIIEALPPPIEEPPPEEIPPEGETPPAKGTHKGTADEEPADLTPGERQVAADDLGEERGHGRGRHKGR
jgi:hypothetical protein